LGHWGMGPEQAYLVACPVCTLVGKSWRPPRPLARTACCRRSAPVSPSCGHQRHCAASVWLSTRITLCALRSPGRGEHTSAEDEGCAETDEGGAGRSEAPDSHRVTPPAEQGRGRWPLEPWYAPVEQNCASGSYAYSLALTASLQLKALAFHCLVSSH